MYITGGAVKVPRKEGSMNVFQNPIKTTASAIHAAVKKYRLFCVGSFVTASTNSFLPTSQNSSEQPREREKARIHISGPIAGDTSEFVHVRRFEDPASLPARVTSAMPRCIALDST